ncbi:MAG: hypothetical protein AAGG07_13495 [Planctomycetota bacterium]
MLRLTAAAACAFVTGTASASSLIGIDFNDRVPTTGLSPLGWNTITLDGAQGNPANSFTGLTVNSLSTTGGEATGIGLEITGSQFLNDFGVSGFGPQDGTPAGGTVAEGLDSSIDDYFTDTAEASFRLSGLESGKEYYFWVMGLRAFSGLTNVISVQSAEGSTEFSQIDTAVSRLWINDELGDSTRSFQSYAHIYTADANGEISFAINREAPNSWGVAGLAVQLVPAPSAGAMLAIAGLAAARRRRDSE